MDMKNKITREMVSWLIIQAKQKQTFPHRSIMVIFINVSSILYATVYDKILRKVKSYKK